MTELKCVRTKGRDFMKVPRVISSLSCAHAHIMQSCVIHNINIIVTTFSQCITCRLVCKMVRKGKNFVQAGDVKLIECSKSDTYTLLLKLPKHCLYHRSLQEAPLCY